MTKSECGGGERSATPKAKAEQKEKRRVIENKSNKEVTAYERRARIVSRTRRPKR